MRTDAQRAADAALDAAVREVVSVEDRYEGEYVTDWLVLYACADPADPERTVYGAAYPDGSLATYRVLGLLAVAEHHVASGAWDDD